LSTFVGDGFSLSDVEVANLYVAVDGIGGERRQRGGGDQGAKEGGRRAMGMKDWRWKMEDGGWRLRSRRVEMGRENGDGGEERLWRRKTWRWVWEWVRDGNTREETE
jgi:hypothetical protein